ncbi:MAG: toll/interleukin-1 receptor domain-containing protein [Cytophagales bacterium]|nr:MAG: toll/interleukin-1 receptor domain-containing protein [Cytophagales bacterium]TAF62325.1 MAG: toll/interleukin-1 receptor domain-containing protein [Cytophagales bacterium]
MLIKDAFISYGRKESVAFAARIFQTLKLNGYEVWFDKVNIPISEQWRISIDDGIRSAKNFIFVMAPHSVASKNCLEELELALKYGKRIIPVMHVNERDKSNWQTVNGLIGKYHRIEAKEDVQDVTDLKKWADGMENRWDELEDRVFLSTWSPFTFPPIDNFEEAMKEIMKVIEKHKTYVSTHTELLVRANHWDKHGHATKYLLVGDIRKRAELWLDEEFVAPDQPPCSPTELICDYISESAQNANNLLCDVFLCFSSKDKAVLRHINYALKRKGITTWTYRSDTRIGEDFEKATQRGVLQAASFVILISQNSLAAGHCLDELEYARSLNKRIIPIMLENVPVYDLPDALRGLSNINFGNVIDFINNPDSSYLKQEFAEYCARLVTEIHYDRNYFRRHTMYLVQADRWRKQNENKSILLRGYNLSEAQSFLNQGKSRSNNPPLALHEDFIRASEINLSNLYTDVFISYSRADADFARKLNYELQLMGKNTWFDQESIAKTSNNFEEEIYKGIDNAACFLFIITESSIKSPFCTKEVSYALKQRKKFIPVLLEPLQSKFSLPASVQQMQWVDFLDKDFMEGCGEVMRSLEIDREHANEHSRWLTSANEWDRNDRKVDYLLASEPSFLAADWLKNAKLNNKMPQPTYLQEEFINASVKAREKAKKRREIVASRNRIVMYFALIISVVAIFFAIKSERRGDELEEAKAKQDEAFQELYAKNIDLIKAKNFNDSLNRIAREATGQNRNLSIEKQKLVEDLITGDKSRTDLAEQLGACQSQYQVLDAKYKMISEDYRQLKDEKGNIKSKLLRYNRTFEKELDKIFAPNSIVGNNKEGMKAAVRENLRPYKELERDINK